MKPEELPSAPSPAMDLQYAMAILKEAKDEPNTVQWVFTRSLVAKAAEWGKEMAGKQASLRPMTNDNIRAYLEGFMLPLFCLQGARLSINEGKEKYLRVLTSQPQSYATTVIKKNLDLFISALKQDPSGSSLIRAMADMYRENFPDPYLIKGIELCADVYESYWQYFPRFAREVDLW